MNNREVMQQALEALDMNLPVVEDYGDTKQLERQRRAITALHAALAEPNDDYERGFIDGMKKQAQSSVDKAVNGLTLKAQAALAEPAEPSEMVLVPRRLLERASESLGAFVSDYGWAQADMDVMDDIDGTLAASRGCALPRLVPKAEQCQCGDRPAAECPGEWEPGCDLGANEAHAKVFDGDPQNVGRTQTESKQEPVAWRVLRSDGQYELYFVKASAERAAECYISRPQVEPLYTAPQRQPLSDEEIDRIACSSLDAWICARAIEAAHGITGETK